MKQKRYVVGYIEYQRCAFGDDSYDGWCSTYSISVFDNKISAVNLANQLKGLFGNLNFLISRND